MRLERLFLLGFLLIFMGLAIIMAGAVSAPNTSTGVVVFIGPIPLIFGSGPYGGQLALISLIASIGMALFLYLWVYSRRSGAEQG